MRNDEEITKEVKLKYLAEHRQNKEKSEEKEDIWINKKNRIHTLNPISFS